ncbi:MAG: hypothetical protein WA836_18615, partial [Candidatus Binataceae bacterium]
HANSHITTKAPVVVVALVYQDLQDKAVKSIDRFELMYRRFQSVRDTPRLATSWLTGSAISH